MESARNHMNKIYALESRHSASQGVTRYLMPGNRHQLTSSTMQARKFFSFDDACAAAQEIGGMKVVELNFTAEQIVQMRDGCLLQANKEFWQEMLNHMNPEFTFTLEKLVHMAAAGYFGSDHDAYQMQDVWLDHMRASGWTIGTTGNYADFDRYAQLALGAAAMVVK
jgi:hypothetical protein